MPEALTILERWGLPTALLLFLLYALWKSGSYVGTRLLCEEQGIVTRLAARGVSFLDALQTTTEQQAHHTASNTQILESLAALTADPTSPVSTVHTNRALIHLAELLETLARHHGVDVSQHVNAIRAALTARALP